MTPANTANLLTLLESADNKGRVCFYVPNSELVRNKDQAREYLLTVFMFNAAVTLRLERVKKAISDIDLVLVPATETHTAVVINLAKLLQLRGAAPAEELAAYREMVLEMRAFYEAHPTERCSIQVCNNRDHNRRVYGTVACRVPSKTAKNMADQDEAATKSLRARVEGSPALAHWLRQMALTLQTIGPWASALIREEDLFGYCDGPYAKHVMQRVLAEAGQAPAKKDAAPLTLVPLDI